MSKKIKIIQKEDEEVPTEIIAQAIFDLAKGMKKLNESRLKESVIVTLLTRTSGVARGHVEVILNCLKDLENLYLKPKAKK